MPTESVQDSEDPNPHSPVSGEAATGSSSASFGKLWVLLLNAFVDMLGYAMVFPLLPLYAVRFEAGPLTIGILVASFSIAQVAASPIWGRLSDRWGRRPALLVSLAGSAAAFAIFAIANSIELLFLSRIVQGASGGTTGVMQAYVGDSVPPRERAKALGWLSAATNTGVMLGPAIGSTVWALGTSVPGALASSLCLFNLVCAWWLLPESRVAHRDADASAPAPTKQRISAMVWECLRHPARDAAQLVWIYAVTMTAFSSFTAILALFLHQRFGLDESNIGYIFFVIGATSVIMRAGLLGRLISRFGEVPLMRVGAGFIALGLLLFPLPERLAWLIPVLLFMPIGTALLFPASTGLLTQRCHKDQLGQMMGVQQAFGGVARIAGPIWAGAAFSEFGPSVPFWVAGLVVVFVTYLTTRLTVDR